MQYSELLCDLFLNLKALYQTNLKIPNASFQQILAVFLIKDDGVEMSKLSIQLGIDNSTATRLIDGLERKNWIKREKDKVDNRIIKVFLTFDGKKIYNSIENQLEKIGFLIEEELDLDLRGEIIELGHSLNWAIIKKMSK
tara:strand:- start:1973 stop:2392 length:420 start_codon:yes stop_codon:yes gene_type:complete